MIRSPNVRILWLTDIHFSAAYKAISGDKGFKAFRNEFYERAGREHEDSPFNYIFITGDLAQNGSVEDYKAFWEFFLKILLDRLLENTSAPVPKVITIPGNHDVQWDNATFFNEYIWQFNIQLETKGDRWEFLRDKEKKFRTLFNDYQESMVRDFPVQKGYEQFFDFHELQLSQSWAESRLYGHIVDHEHHMIIILLNTAWYSLGTKFTKLYADRVFKNELFTRDLKSTAAALNQKDYFSEYANQLTGVSFLENDNIQKLLDEYPDYIVLTCMHHPINWLSWNEYYTYEEKPNETATRFQNLINRSDLLLTGHEHIPVNMPNEMIAGKTIHLKGGCFLFDNQHNGIRLDHSWFSILDIDTKKGRLKQSRILFKSKEHNWEQYSATHLPFARKNDKYPLLPERLARLQQKFRGSGACHLVEAYGRHLKWLAEDDHLEERAGDDLPYYTYRHLTDKTCAFFLLAIKDNFYQELLTDKVMHHFEEMLSDSGDRELIIRLVVGDIFVYNEARIAYEKGNICREEILQRVVNESDRQFDVFRHKLFSRYESRVSIDGVVRNDQNGFYGLKASNNIVPYWLF